MTLDGPAGVLRRIRAINRYITKNYHDQEGGPMETFDLSECYSKLDQKEIVCILSRMITSAFQRKGYLAISPYEKTGR